MALPTKKTIPTLDYTRHSYLIYGDPKIGKTTLVSKMGNDEKKKVLFFTTEPGHSFVSIYPWKTLSDENPTKWEDFLECAKEFSQADDYSLLAIDTAGHLVRWCEQYVLNKRRVEDESEGNYGDIYRRILREFTRVINKLGQLGKGIIFISHVNPKKEKEGVIYPDLPEKYTNLFNGMVDYIFYCYATADGSRMIRTKGNDAIVAGDRSGLLPANMPMDISALIGNLSQQNKKTVDQARL